MKIRTRHAANADFQDLTPNIYLKIWAPCGKCPLSRPDPEHLNSFQKEAGEVAGFGDGQQNRVVAALRKRFQDADGDACVACGFSADFLEEAGCDVV
jgi:hypothetical protein